MGIPNLPKKNRKEAYLDLLESIALQESAVAALVLAETEKMKALACYIGEDCCPLSVQESLQLQDAIKSVLQSAVKMQMLLQCKLEHILDSIVHIVIQSPLPSPPPQPAVNCRLSGRGQGVITNPLDSFFGGTAHVTDLLIHVEDSRTTEAMFAYQAKKQGMVIRLTGLPGTISVQHPAAPGSGYVECLVVTGRGVADILNKNQTPQTEECSFTFTLWHSEVASCSPGRFQLVTVADRVAEVNHDSGVVTYAGKLMMTESRK